MKLYWTLKTKHNNYLVKLNENFAAYVDENSKILRLCNISEWEWAKNEWNVEKHLYSLSIPSKIEDIAKRAIISKVHESFLCFDLEDDIPKGVENDALALLPKLFAHLKETDTLFRFACKNYTRVFILLPASFITKMEAAPNYSNEEEYRGCIVSNDYRVYKSKRLFIEYRHDRSVPIYEGTLEESFSLFINFTCE